jgi:uncharacterized delta-60 repeat protein
MKKIFEKATIVFILIFHSIVLFSQNQAGVATDFGPFPGFGGDVLSIAVQNDGKIIVGGEFGYYNGVDASQLIRLNSDGSKDTGFNIGTGFNGFGINFVAIQSDGKILVGGSIITFNGISENNLVRLNTDGSKDITFNIGSGFNGNVNFIEIQSDGKILVGGEFSTFNGNLQSKLIRLNNNGSIDTTFNINSGFNSGVNSIVTQNDGKIVVGGSFNSYNGISQNGLIRLNPDGSKDTTFNVGTGFNGWIKSIAIQSDGKIIVGGDYTNYNNVLQNKLIRLNLDGTKDVSFNIGSGFNGWIETIAIQSDGKIIVGGTYDSFNNIQNQLSIVRLNSGGSKDTAFNIGTGFNNLINTIKLKSDGKIIVGGNFYEYNELSENSIIQLNNNGSKDFSFNTGNGFGKAVYAIKEQSDGKILVSGEFISYQSVNQNRLIRFNPDGTKDLSFNIGTGFNEGVYCIAVQSDGKILVGGSFSSYNGTIQNGIIRLNSNGTKDISFNIGTGINSGISPYRIQTIQIQSDGKILVGGSFSSYNGISQNGIIRLNSNGTKDTTFNIGSGFNGSIESIAIQSDGKIVVGGDYTSYNNISQNRLIRLNSDATKDFSFNIGIGFYGFVDSVNSIVIQSDGKIIVGGGFAEFNGIVERGLIRLNSDGTKDLSFNIGAGFNNGRIASIGLQADGKILIGGDFDNFNGISQNHLIRLNSNGVKDTAFNIGTGFIGWIHSIVINSNGKIFIGGNFASYNDNYYYGLLALNGNGILSNEDLVNANNNINIFPNPANTHININFNNINDLTGGAIKIINSLGQQVATTPITATGTKTTMSLNRWGCSGLYFVQILNPQGQIVDIKKIILQ